MRPRARCAERYRVRCVAELGGRIATRMAKLNFQQMLLQLCHFWQQRDCILIQPLDCEVGAGTAHPATFLRAIGPEPWRAAYPQPSRRPQDGRYGENPNRLQRYYQYQVVLKPSPDDFQSLFLQSLADLGIVAADNDVRFIEDNWESPTLGAWGLGWEVQVNGMEIAQVTYFQEVGGRKCAPVMGEITYGLERIAMHLQGVDDVFQIAWNDTLCYGDVYRDNEEQQSRYNFERADVAAIRDLFTQYENDTRALLATDSDSGAPLVLPAYEMTLKCSHLFNLLDARGAISVTARTDYVKRIRRLARAVADAYYEDRKSRGFPLLAAAEGAQ